MIFVFNKRHYDGDGEYIGRGNGSVLGNPFSHLPNTRAEFRVQSRDEAIDRYKIWLEDKMKSDNKVSQEVYRLVRKYEKDKSLVLICWCSPLACHGDILKDLIKELAND